MIIRFAGLLDAAAVQAVVQRIAPGPWDDGRQTAVGKAKLVKNNKLIVHLGDRPDCWKKEGWPNLPQSDWVEGAFSSPHDLHVDRQGNIYVAEWLSNGTGKITKLIRL